MKQELRCHAVLCPSENKARLMAKRLKERLHQALIDFKKEKVWRQNARLSLANAADEQKTMPFRKIMLQAGSSNYRPPLEKGKSAPKLKVIEEVIFEEDEENLEDETDEDMFHHTIKVRMYIYFFKNFKKRFRHRFCYNVQNKYILTQKPTLFKACISFRNSSK